MIDKIKEEGKQLRFQMREKVVGYIGAGFGVIASLAWNEAIKALIEHLFPLQQDTIMAKFVYAGCMTIVLVLVSFYIIKIFDKKDKT